MPTHRSVRHAVLEYFKKHGRAHLPWRKTTKAYRILVSEIMLQQTQVDRVMPFYKNFLKQFPTPAVLSQAPRSDVLKAWSGLGYNRRAKFLHEAARAMVMRHRGKVPQGYDELRALPGVGEYTAKAVRVFAHNEPEVLIETNVRTVIIHHYFQKQAHVSEPALLDIATHLAAGQDPRTWHGALMDYGTHLKATHGNLSRKSAQYTKQKPFKGSLREVRGAVLKVLHPGAATQKALQKALPQELHDRLDAALLQLQKEGLITKDKGTFRT